MGEAAAPATTGSGTGDARRARPRDPAPESPGPGRAWAFRLAPSSRVPLRDQIAVQVVTAVRAGAYGSGDRLPSVRALATRLDVHRNTVRAAYRKLAAHGVVEARPGSGVYVAPRPPPDGPSPSTDLPPRGRPFRRFLARERARGRSWGDVAELMDRWRGAVAARRVTVVAGDDDLRRVWVRELRDTLSAVDVDVAGLPPSEAGARPGRLARTVVAATAGRLAELRPLLPPWSEGTVLRPGPSPRTRRLLLQLPPGSVVVLVSRSRVLRRETRELAAALRGGEVAVRGLAPGDVDRRRRALRVARFVLTDVVCRPALAPEVGRRRLLTLRHLAREPARELARCFGPPAVPAGAGRSGGHPPSRSREGGEP